MWTALRAKVARYINPERETPMNAFRIYIVTKDAAAFGEFYAPGDTLDDLLDALDRVADDALAVQHVLANAALDERAQA